jgi:KaiC/GvpD/RAD55 family RecA-like ATPase
MPPRTSPKRTSASASRKSQQQRTESAEVRRSRRAAMLQLRMGRFAHIIGMSSALALALTALISYGLIHWDFIRYEWLGPLVWFIPLITGVASAAVALWIKWEPYVADREQPHFVMSLVALVVPLLIIALIVLDEYGHVALGRPPWLYSASLLGICLAEVSLAMTWEGTGRRKISAVLAAVFPVVLLLFPIIYNLIYNLTEAELEQELARILPMAYLGSAVSIHLSGAMLHIIASSTSLMQREVLRASDSKLKEQLVDLDKKRAALRYREDAFRARESGLEVYEKQLEDQLAAMESKREQIATMEAEAEQRLELLRVDREKTAKQEADLESQRDGLQLKLGAIESQKRELDKRVKSLEAKEDAISRREIESNKLLIDATAKDRDIKHRLAEVEAEHKEIDSTREELESLQAALAEREKQLGLRESRLEMKGMELASAKEQLGKVVKEKTAVRSLQEQLLAMQQALAEKEISVKAAEDDIRQKSEKAERLIARADKQMNDLVEKEGVVIAREKALADKEFKLRAELEAVNSKLAEMDSAEAVMGDREKQYEDLSSATRSKMSAITVQEEEVSRKMDALAKREDKIKELESRLKTEHELMNSKLKQLLEKEKYIKAQEAEMGLKRAELKAMEREILESAEDIDEVRAEYPVPEADEREKAFEFREKRLVEKEQELKSRLYQREKELEKREAALKAHLQKDVDEREESVEEEYAEEKVKTGIERLDDLLMGGMPFGSNVLYVGPPFIGKEIAMLMFLAEGLRKGVPAVIVTTSRTPTEIAKDMAPILPTFMEFENLGLVHWVDASGLAADGHEAGRANIHSVPKPGDVAGIQKALDACVKVIQKQRHPYFRLAYMSVSMSITQTDDKSAFQFVQTLAGRMKQANAVSVYAIERGMHTEQQLETIQTNMSGAVQFKTDKQKTLLSVQGIGDAQTRAWIEYRHTNKAIMIGAFSLERIR